jgi:putative acetyltransferase
VILRRASLADAAAIAALHRLSMRTAMPWLADIHTPAEDLAFFSGEVLPVQTVWLAEEGGAVVGYAATFDGWLNQLYVHPDHHGAGIGSALLEVVRSASVALSLWAFQRNSQARAFYEAKGFRLVRLTDGADNEEGEPDALYQWRRAD